MNTRQTKNGEDAPCIASVPAGTTLLENIQSSSITKGPIISNSGRSVQPTNQPLPPDFTANYVTTDKENITITTTVLIDAAVTINDLQIYMNNNISMDGNYVLTGLHVGYCYQEEVPTSLFPYTFTFEIATGSTLGIISEIELYLYNEDPITSSGKKTKVQPPA